MFSISYADVQLHFHLQLHVVYFRTICFLFVTEDTDGSLAGNTALPPSSFDSTESQSTSTVIFERSLTDDPYQSSPDDNYSRNTVTETTAFPDTLEGRTVPRDRFPSSSLPSVPAEPQPTLLVTAKTASSVTLAWDDFKPQHHAGDTPSYVAEYRPFGGHTEPHQWRRKQLPPGGSDGALPLMLIDGLQPGEEYEVRVSIYQDGARELRGASTETIRFFTDGKQCRYSGVDRFYYDFTCVKII